MILIHIVTAQPWMLIDRSVCYILSIILYISDVVIKRIISRFRHYDIICNDVVCLVGGGESTDLKIDNLDRVSIPTKIVATFDVEHPILGTTYGV